MTAKKAVDQTTAAFVWQDDMNVVLDFDSLTLGDLEDLEDLTGLGIRKLGTSLQQNADEMPVAHLRALAYVALRKGHPGVTYDDTRAVPLTAILGGLSGDAVDPPG